MADEHGEYREEFPEAGEHPHQYDHSEPKYSIIAILGGVTVVLLIVVSIGIQQYYDRTESSLVYNKVLSQPNWVLEDLRRKEATELSQYSYFDKQKGSVRIPVEQAMKAVIAESATGKEKYPTSDYKVKTAAEIAAAGQVSQPGAAAAVGNQNQGVTSSPNVQNPATPQQPHK